MIRFLDAGESHGKALVAILEGMPSNCKINIDYINQELSRRQKGYGRGERMKIEKDKVEIWSGIRNGKTTGNPITIVIYNNDYSNWSKLFTSKELNNSVTVPRPGHGDLVGYVKYMTGDIRDVIERTSARETAIRTAVGALCKDILLSVGIDVRSKIKSIGNLKDNEVDIFNDDIYNIIEESEVRCYNKEIEILIKKEIDKQKEEGDTLGGVIYLSIKGVPIGIGSYTQWDRKLDAILSYQIMSVQGIKAVEFGRGLDTNILGSRFNDEIIYKGNKIVRPSNNCGGIEAGVSNGSNIEINAFMKPIPSIKKQINSIDLYDKTNVKNRYERSDICAVVPGSVVLENVCSYAILKELLNKFPCDDYNMLKKAIIEYREYVSNL